MEEPALAPASTSPLGDRGHAGESLGRSYAVQDGPLDGARRHRLEGGVGVAVNLDGAAGEGEDHIAVRAAVRGPDRAGEAILADRREPVRLGRGV